MENETLPLHLAFAQVREEKKEERETVIRRCAASIFWCNQYFDAFEWAVPEFKESDLDEYLSHFDDPQMALSVTAQLRETDKGVTEIQETLGVLTVDDMEKIAYAIELQCGISLAASEMITDDSPEAYERDFRFMQRQTRECAGCERAISYLILSHIVHQVTLPASVLTHIAHAEDPSVRSDFKDTLVTGLDYAYQRALEMGVES